MTAASNDVRAKADDLEEQSRIFIDRIRDADRRKEARDDLDSAYELTVDGNTVKARMIDISPSGAAISTRASG